MRLAETVVADPLPSLLLGITPELDQAAANSNRVSNMSAKSGLKSKTRGPAAGSTHNQSERCQI